MDPGLSMEMAPESTLSETLRTEMDPWSCPASRWWMRGSTHVPSLCSPVEPIVKRSLSMLLVGTICLCARSLFHICTPWEQLRELPHLRRQKTLEPETVCQLVANPVLSGWLNAQFKGLCSVTLVMSTLRREQAYPDFYLQTLYKDVWLHFWFPWQQDLLINCLIMKQQKDVWCMTSGLKCMCERSLRAKVGLWNLNFFFFAIDAKRYPSSASSFKSCG